jgi:hypothetical protein
MNAALTGSEAGMNATYEFRATMTDRPGKATP